MYVCLECGYRFEEPKRYEERHGLDRFEGPGEWFSVCPACGGAYVDEQEVEDGLQ